MCLQTLLEFAPQPDETPVYCVSQEGDYVQFRLRDLIPHGFASAAVTKKP
jgi:cytidine deaminase